MISCNSGSFGSFLTNDAILFERTLTLASLIAVFTRCKFADIVGAEITKIIQDCCSEARRKYKLTKKINADLRCGLPPLPPLENIDVSEDAQP